MTHQNKKRIGAIIVCIAVFIQAVFLSGDGVLLQAAAGDQTGITAELTRTTEETVTIGAQQILNVKASNQTAADTEYRLALTDETLSTLDDITAVIDKYPTAADGTQLPVSWNTGELLNASNDTYKAPETTEAVTETATETVQETAETTSTEIEQEAAETAEETEAAEDASETAEETATEPAAEAEPAQTVETETAAETEQTEPVNVIRQYLTVTVPANTDIEFNLTLTSALTEERNLTVTAEAYQEGNTQNLITADAENQETTVTWNNASIVRKSPLKAPAANDTSDTSDSTGITVYFKAPNGSADWTDPRIYVFNDSKDVKLRSGQMSSFTVEGNTYYYYTFTTDELNTFDNGSINGFLFVNGSTGWSPQTVNINGYTNINVLNGKYFEAQSTLTNDKKNNVKKSDISSVFTSHAGKEIKLVNYTDKAIDSVIFTDLLGNAQEVEISDGSITFPADKVSGIPYTYINIDGENDIDLNDENGYSETNNTYYYGVTTNSGGGVVVSYWGTEPGSESLAGKKLYFDTNYKFFVDGREVTLTEETLGSKKAYTYTFQSDATQSTLLSIQDQAGTTYRFYWNDLEKDAVTIGKDQIAVVSKTHENLQGTAISSAADFKNMTFGRYYLTQDITVSDMKTINDDVVLDLNGHKITTTSVLFDIKGGSLTIEDSAQVTSATPEKVSELSELSAETALAAHNGWARTGSVEKNNNGDYEITYYVTESVPTATDTSKGTTDTTYKHVDTVKGAIVTNGSNDQVIYVDNGCTFNLNGGLITQGTAQVNHLVEINSGIFNMNGGYLAGANSKDTKIGGAAVYSKNSNCTMNMNGGVIANNTAIFGGAIYQSGGATFNMTGGIISGNGCDNNGSGGGVFSGDSTVNISGGYITNNKATGYDESKQDSCTTHGGGGIATSKGSLKMSGGYVTGNYSGNSGGGIYVGFYGSGTKATFTGGVIASNICDIGEGGGIRIAGGKNESGSKGTISGNTYVTNNGNLTGAKSSNYNKQSNAAAGTWGGGGIFVQEDGSLTIAKALITNNDAGGFGGGFAACPSGVTNGASNDGAAIYGNTAQDRNMTSSNSTGSKNKDLLLHNGGKGDTVKAYLTEGSQNAKDYFSAGAVTVSGSMLGYTTANWFGYKDNETQVENIDMFTTISANDYIVMNADPSPEDQKEATKLSTVVISGNYSYTHGGGVMTNGSVKLGSASSEDSQYPAIRLSGTKSVTDSNGTALPADQLKQYAGQFEFEVGKGNAVVENGSVVLKNVIKVATAQMLENGSFNLDWNIESSDFNKFTEENKSDTVSFYLFENAGENDQITYDSTIYRVEMTIKVKVETIQASGHDAMKYYHYYIDGVKFYKLSANGSNVVETETSDFTANTEKNDSETISWNGTMFTNVLKSYELPKTGGSGTTEMAMVGLALAAGGTLTKNKRKTRRERRNINRH